MSIAIRPIAAHAEYHALEQLQRDVWSLPDVEVVPLHVLITAAKNGGVLLGAFDEERLAGFVFGFLGLTPDGKVKHCSHMAGVHPDYRDRGLGTALKLAQRLHVLSQGIDLITWTFDPLETRNASLNFHKLGAVCATYLPNLYGDMRDGLNAGLPSDRFEVAWWIAGERVARRLAGEPGPGVDEILAAGVRVVDDLPPSDGEREAGRLAERLLVPVPTAFQAIKAVDVDQARSLRLRTRSLFERAFAMGYVVTDFFVDGEQGYYLIEMTGRI